VLFSGVARQVPITIRLEDRIRSEIRVYETAQGPSAVTPGDFDPLQWWSQHTDDLPLLSGIARRIFVITASSAECERHFSAFNARHIITAQRNAMYPETVEALSIVLEGYKNKLIS
jgi:hypothetical protein